MAKARLMGYSAAPQGKAMSDDERDALKDKRKRERQAQEEEPEAALDALRQAMRLAAATPASPGGSSPLGHHQPARQPPQHPLLLPLLVALVGVLALLVLLARSALVDDLELDQREADAPLARRGGPARAAAGTRRAGAARRPRS